MAFYGFRQQATCVKRRAVGRCNDANLALRNHRCLTYRNTKEIRMDGPKARRQSAKLDAFDATLFDEGDWILKVVVRVLGAIGGEDSTRRHWLAIDCFDYSQFVSADFNQRHFADDALERVLD